MTTSKIEIEVRKDLEDDLVVQSVLSEYERIKNQYQASKKALIEMESRLCQLQLMPF